MDTTSGFASLDLALPLLNALSALGYEEPTPIQRAAIPALLVGRDLLGQAATGTGKTAAFALPLLQRVTRDKNTRALVLVPTRELAMQVAEAVHRYGKGFDTSVLAVYGGAPMYTQVKALGRGVTVVVATPGRALDHVRRGTLRLDNIEVVVLDEADEMLDMGFAEDLEALLKATPPTRQTALFSATLPARIAAIAAQHLRDPVRLSILREKVAPGALPKIRQTAYVVARAHKPAALGRVLDMESPSSAIVFCRTRTEVDDLTETLNGRGYQAEALHGGLTQEQRDRVMKRFRTGATELLIATDVAARGLDIEHVSHVVNYDVPSAPESYVHRIGRTGRAGREGVAITLTEPREHRLLRNIEALTRQRIEVAMVPTVADLRARQMDLLRALLRETILAGDLDRFRGVIESLAAEFDVMDIAAAGLKLAQNAELSKDEDAVEIPTVHLSSERPLQKPPKAARRPGALSKKGGAPNWEVTRIFIGAGRQSGIRPADLVGAIANEAQVQARAIGAIQISERHSLVEVPSEIAADVIAALRATKIKGRKLLIRRDQEQRMTAARTREHHVE